MAPAVMLGFLAASRVAAAAPVLDWAQGWSRTSGGNGYLGASFTDAAGTTWLAVSANDDQRLLKYTSAGTMVQNAVMDDPEWPTIYAITVDGSGNCYLAGQAYDGMTGNSVLYVAKYGSAAGSPLWTRSVYGGAGVTFEASAIATDGTGVWVSGYRVKRDNGPPWSQTGTGAIVKLAAAAGTVQWSRTAGPDKTWFGRIGIASDGAGNAFLAGDVADPAYFRNDVLVTKFNAGGTVLFSRTLNSNGWSYQYGSAAAWFAGSLYVAGTSFSDVLVLLVDGATGDLVASGLYANGDGHNVLAMAVDGSGGVYVGGFAYAIPSTYWFLARFDPALGMAAGWPVTVSMGGSWANTLGVGADAAGNGYLVTQPGWQMCETSRPVSITRYSSGSGVSWSGGYDVPADEDVFGAGPDGSGNIVVGGMSGRVPRLLKYDSSGGLQSASLAGPATHCSNYGRGFFQQGADSYLSVAGLDLTSTFYEDDVEVLKYDSGGVLTREFVFKPFSSVIPGPVAVDAGGNVYLAASAMTGTYWEPDLLLVKFDPLGNVVWSRTINYTVDDIADGVAVDGSGGIFVLETTPNDDPADVDNRIALLKFDSSGSLLWTKTYGSGPVSFFGFDLKVAGANVYFCGAQVDPLFTALSGWVYKLDSNGTTLWSKSFNGGQNAYFRGLNVDGFGNVFAAGVVGTVDMMNGVVGDFVTVSYDSSGNLRWSPQPTYDSGSVDDIGRAVALGSIYVAGRGGGNARLLKYTEGGAGSALLSGALAVTPNPASIGVTVQVVLSVTNTGTANATGVMPALQINAGGSAVAYRTGPLPGGPVTLASGGGSQKFTWTYSVTGAAVIEFTGTASGTNAGTGGGILVAATAPLASVPVSRLVSAMAVSPATGYVGSLLIVTLTVSNTGSADATLVVPSLAVGPGGGLVSYIAGPVPAGPLTILAGSATVFGWAYGITGAGAATFTATATGVDAVLGTVAVSAGRAVPLLRPAALAAAVSVGPSPAKVGTLVSVVLTVTNTGQVAATNVSATLAVGSGASLVDWRSGPSPPGPLSIPAGASWTFGWTYSVTGAGVISLASTATGTDSGLGGAIASGAIVGIQAAVPASLAAAMSVVTAAGSSTAFVGEWFEVRCTVSNTGGSTASGVGVALGLDPGTTAAVPWKLGPVPAGPLALAPGASQTFVWTYSASGRGWTDFIATAAGTDALFGATVAGAVAPLTVQEPARLTVLSCAAVPATVSVGQLQAVQAVIRNAGDVAATGVSATILCPGVVAWASGPSPAGPFTLPAGVTVTVTWTFTGAAAGAGVYSVTATGTDSGTAAALAAAASTAGLVQTPANMVAGMAAWPGVLKQGQVITVTVFVANAGGASALGVTPSTEPGPLPAAAVARLSGPSPAGPLTVPGGGWSAFTWTYEAVQPAVLSFSATVAGADANSGAPVSSVAACWTVTVTAGAALRSFLVVTPTAVKTGETVEVRLTVSNTGLNNATGVTPALTFADPGMASVAAGPTPAGGVTVAGGAAVTFVWQVTARQGGTLALTAEATGTDAGDSASVSTQATGTVAIASRFEDPVVVYPNPVSTDRLNVALRLDGDADEVTVEAFNASFESVFRGTWKSVTQSDGAVVIDGVRRWAPGPYVIRVRVKLADGRDQKMPLAKVMVKR